MAVGWNERGTVGRGFIGLIGTEAPFEVVGQPLEVGPDPVIRFANGQLFVLNSDDDQVRVVNPSTFTIDRTFSLNSDSTPVDIAVTGPSTAYVTLRGHANILRVDLTSGEALPVLDLGTLAEKGAVPELGTMTQHDGRLFVQVRSLDRDEPGQPSFLAVIDLATERIVDIDPAREGTQLIELEGTTPKGKMQVVSQNRRLWVNSSGGFFDEGGLESIDLDALRSDGLAVRESAGETGADLNAFVMLDERRGYLTYTTDLLASSHLHKFTAEGAVDPVELNVAVDYITPAMVYEADGDRIFLPVGGFGEDGVHVFDGASGRQLTDRPVLTSGPPTDVVLIPEPGALGCLLAVLCCTGRPRRECRVNGEGKEP